MSLLPANIVELIDAEKEISFRPEWDIDSDRRYYIFTCPLTVGGITVGGFELRAKISKEFVDRDAMLQLEFTRSVRDRTELWRCQWRPLETHTNKSWGPNGYAFARFDRKSHHHPFHCNFIPTEMRMRGGSLPGALPINPDPGSLSAFVAFCGECFKIKNMQLIRMPQMSADFFWMPDG